MIRQLVISSLFFVVVLFTGNAFAGNNSFSSTSNDYGSLTVRYNAPDEILFTYAFNTDKNITRALIGVGDYDFADFNTVPPLHISSATAAEVPSLSTVAAIGLIILILIMGTRILSVEKGIAIIAVLALLVITGNSSAGSYGDRQGNSWQIIHEIDPAQDGSYTISGLNAGNYTYCLIFISSSSGGPIFSDPLTVTVTDNSGDWYIGSDLTHGGIKKGIWTMSDGKLLLLGSRGFGDVYDLSTQSWTAISTYSTPNSTLTTWRSWGNACKIEGTDKIILPAPDSSIGIGIINKDTTTIIYDYSTDTWSETGSFINSRWGAEVTCMPNGKVLLIGGHLSSNDPASSVEIYDPATGQWSLAAPMSQNRMDHKAVVLKDGRVLVIGGHYTDSQSGTIYLNTAEVYDPQTDTWTDTGQLAEDRFKVKTILLADGKVLVAGGYRSHYGFLDTVEIYDPTTNTWSATDSMKDRKYGFTLILMADGRVMAVGGRFQDEVYGQTAGGQWYASMSNMFILTTVEIYDPSTGTWSETNQIHYRREHPFGITLSDGSIMIGGGWDSAYTWYASTEIYFP